MKIISINSLNNKVSINQNLKPQVFKTNPLEKQPSCDTVSFKAKAPKFNKTLYRAIGLEELKLLLKGESVGGYKYATTSPMGYGANTWANGFASSRKNIFFIKFKEKHFSFMDVTDRRDFENDTRYVINKEINIDDVHSIYKGHNINGEMIWAQDESLKTEDKRKKLNRISEIFKELENNNNIGNLIMELGSYAEEFPNIASMLMKNEKLSLETYDLTYLANQSNDAQYYNYIKNLLETSLKESNPYIVTPFAIRYMTKFAKKEDLDLVLEVSKKDPEKNKRDYPSLIGNIASEKDVPRLEKMFEEGDYLTKETLLWTFEILDSKKITQNKAFDYCEKLLNKIKDFKESDYRKDNNLYDLLFSCVHILDQNKKYLKLKPELVECFCNLNLGTDPDFKFYYDELTK